MQTLAVYTFGGSDLLRVVFNCIAIIFNNKTFTSINTMAFIFGGIAFSFKLILTRDVSQLLKFLVIYTVVTGSIIIPKASIQIIDQADTGRSNQTVDHVPFALALFASTVSKFGAAVTEAIEDVFHNMHDLDYQETGFVMGAKLIEASRQFEITDANFSNNINGFMQQCVFYDILLNKYALNDLLSSADPWEFLKNNTSQARAFPYFNNGEQKIIVCKDGASKLDQAWGDELNRAQTVYGTQLLGASSTVKSTFMSYLPLGFNMLTAASDSGESILKKSMLARSLQKSVTHFGANVNAPAALAAYEDAKTDLQMRHTLDLTGREAGYWLSQIKNVLEATLYGLFILICFFMYLPNSFLIIRNYFLGLLYLQSLSPLFAIVHFISAYYAHSRIPLIGSKLSISTMAITTQVNADAMALSGYLSWLIALGGGLVIFRGLPQFMQSMGQYVGGVLQNIGSHVTAESVAGNISAGNTQFANHSFYNTNANHFDTNARLLSGHFMSQTPEGGNFTITQSGREIIDNQASISNLGVSVHVAESARNTVTDQIQMNYASVMNHLHGYTESYSAAFRKTVDLTHHQSDGTGSGEHYSDSDSTGGSQSVARVSNLVSSAAKHLNVSTERAASLLARAYVEAKVGANMGVFGASAGISAEGSYSQRESESHLYEQAKRFAQDHHFSEAADEANRAVHEKQYREHQEDGARMSDSIASSFDQGDHHRAEAVSSFSAAKSYSQMASQVQEQAATIDANYGQEFKEWLMDQPSLHGSGKMSRSMVEAMSASEKQAYAEQFSHEKASQMVNAFAQNHGLTHGKEEITRDFQQNNQYVDDKLQSIKSKNPYDSKVNQAITEHKFKPVDSSAKKLVQENKQKIESEIRVNKNDIEKEAKELLK